MAHLRPLMAPVLVPGTEPLPPGMTEEDRAEMAKIAKWNKIANMSMESCPVKCALSGAAGFGLGAFFSLMSTSFAVDDPLRRTTLAANGLDPGKVGEMTTMQSTKEFFKQTGKSMYRSGKGFGKVGALYSGIECCIEAYRAKNDLVNPVAAGFAAGAILARNSGPKAAIGGGVAFAAFSGAIDMYFRREVADDD
ncbi:Mitochondrial inner membrane translocase subunit Tim17/Tim22/Tim23/peroxisomal protein PMP24 [Kalmanozyma brasiliensis GHG001]|uniref:Mitochondrial import inner membrane translocase subunit TIM22 n=1 Tax=Kalmanozyma brasiliensis (strain GHG001) TaxID=1365824 RepID=V5E5Y3_KALBG|nr:Mitochondrial inner membrane translocase subunit Tim17/Tim22/Tim23/peroxisomal protein PMP24 [Kalmanozyma brasiliensis GHG001]EST05621.1 Mitochondrial inner membrane translocase subunit Tim17/Tim22/Tim23/peroxisomal protein PMP24 [Kalmanozyma brasiliensis GHG001]